MNKAIFIDKDGTLIKDVPWNVNPQLIQLQPGATAALQQLQQAGYLLVLVSNQAGVALGYFTEMELTPVSKTIQQLIQLQRVKMDAFYYCPHHPQGTVEQYSYKCACRKPEAGMLLQAAADLQIDLSQSWMIGDILNDVEAGNKAGCTTILLDNGGETEWLPGQNRTPHFRVKSWSEIDGTILNSNRQPAKSNDQLALDNGQIQTEPPE